MKWNEKWNRKQLIKAVGIGILAVNLLSGEKADAATITPAIQNQETTIYLDGKDTITVTGKYISSVKYSSSNKKVASISSKGKIVPKKKGKTTINAKVIYRKKKSGKKYTIRLKYNLNVLDKSNQYFKFGKRDENEYKMKGLTEKGKKLKSIITPCYYKNKKVSSVAMQSIAKDSKCTKMYLTDSIKNIQEKAFANSNIEQIYIGKNMNDISGGAFVGCSNLKKFVVHPENKYYLLRDNALLVRQVKKEFAVVALPAKASNTSYDLSKGISYLMNDAFNGCKKLKTVKLDGNMGYLSDRAFYGSGLTELTIPTKIGCIGDDVFNNCKSLEKVTIEAPLLWGEKSGEFRGCSSLKEIYVTEKVKEFPQDMFNSVSSIEKIEIDNKNPYLKVVDNVVYSSDGKMLYYYSSGKKETDYTILDGVTKIGENCFAENSFLENIKMPDSILDIEGGAFYKCAKLKRVKLPAYIYEIPYNCFNGCVSLEKLEIPKNVNIINISSLIDCKNLSEINVDTENTILASKDGVVYSKDMDILFKYPEAKKDTEFTVPNTVKRIDDEAFKDVRFLQKVTMPNQITKLGNMVFENASQLQVIKLSANLDTIPSGCFWNCKKLTQINIPDSVRNIDYYAFYNCSSLTELTVPKNVSNIDFGAFKDCASLTKLYIKTQMLSEQSNVGNYVFIRTGSKNYKKLTIYVPKKKGTLYRSIFLKSGLDKNVTVKEM